MSRRMSHRFRLFLKRLSKGRFTVTYPDLIGTIARNQGLIAQNAERLRRAVQERNIERAY